MRSEKEVKKKKKRFLDNQFVMHFFIPAMPHMYLFYLPQNIQSNTSIFIAINHD